MTNDKELHEYMAAKVCTIPAHAASPPMTRRQNGQHHVFLADSISGLLAAMCTDHIHGDNSLPITPLHPLSFIVTALFPGQAFSSRVNTSPTQV